MGDKSPKAAQKKSAQKESKSKAETKKKQAVEAAKQVVGPKK